MLLAHRWAEGIRIVTCDGKSPDPYVVINDDEGVIVATVEEYGIMGGFPDAESAYPFLPDLDDPATLGCLLALVRDVWGDDALMAVAICYGPGGVRWQCRRTVNGGACTERQHPTEAEALVNALEAAK
jgi:hypothetical protein